MRISRNTFYYIEKELYDYKKTKEYLIELEKDIMLSTPPKYEIRSTDVSDIVFHIVTMMTTHKLKARMEQVVKVIDRLLKEMDSIVRDALSDKYWERPSKSWSRIAFDHSVDNSTLYRWRVAFVKKIAAELGLK
jgi:RinA family phage transcriptional activator